MTSFKALPRVMARARPSAIALATPGGISAFTPVDVQEKWEPNAGVRSLATGDNVITMFDVIGEDWWTGGGVTAKKTAAQLRAIGERDVEVQINSFGGDMFEGLAIYNLLREHKARVTVKVLGLAASAASVIAMAGDELQIGAASFLMIHDCWVMAVGNRHDMAATAELLAPFDAAMADVYAQRSGQTAKACADWMDAETWMNGALAVERGFAECLLDADTLIDDSAAAAAAKTINEVRATEMALISAGMTRTQARARIANLKGTPGAAPMTDITPGADVELGWDAGAFAAARQLLATIGG